MIVLEPSLLGRSLRMVRPNRSRSWLFNNGIIIFPLYLPLCYRRDARSCKSGVKRVHSWLNTGFIMKRTVLGMCVQHLWNSRTFNRLKNGFTSRNWICSPARPCQHYQVFQISGIASHEFIVNLLKVVESVPSRFGYVGYLVLIMSRYWFEALCWNRFQLSFRVNKVKLHSHFSCQLAK